MNRRAWLALATFLLSQGALRADPIALPEAPVRVVIGDAAAFDAALDGTFRELLEGRIDPGDPVASAWRQTLVGLKLEEQWGLFSGDLSLTWAEIRSLSPKAIGLALLDAGNLEAVLVIETPLAEIPLELAEGALREHAGKSYHLVRVGAGDGSEDVDRRMGLAWARSGSQLLVASSARAMEAALEAAPPASAPGPGLVEVVLDMEKLRGDRYFVREFPFPVVVDDGVLEASLRRQGGDLVEVRRGNGGSGVRPSGRRFELPGSAASGWESDGELMLETLRGGILEPIPSLDARPVRALAPLPPARSETVDPYTVDFVKHQAAGAAWEEGDLEAWRKLLGPGEDGRPAVASFGWAVAADGALALAFPWPSTLDRELDLAIRATLERRAGRSRVEVGGKTTTYSVGPGLAVLATRRTGGHVWLASSPRLLDGATEPREEPGLERWARLDLDAARDARDGIARLEERGDGVKPIADRVLGILGWMPSRHEIAVERKRTAQGWEERIVFSQASGPSR